MEIRRVSIDPSTGATSDSVTIAKDSPSEASVRDVWNFVSIASKITPNAPKVSPVAQFCVRKARPAMRQR